MNNEGYLLDNASSYAGRRFEAIAALFDQWTFQHIRALGIGSGWVCWEVGAGGANVPRWLAQHVGPTGRVLSTDIDTSWAQGATEDTVVEVRRHDVTADPMPEWEFDLIHARLVLVHLPERASVVRKMVNALKPGGWLLVEDADPAAQPLACLDADGDAERLANRMRLGVRELLMRRGVDLAFGRKLPRLMRAVGLVDVAADAYFPVVQTAAAELEAATAEMLREKLIAAGLATEDEIAEHLANLAGGMMDVTTAPLFSVWGRKRT